MKRGPVCPMLYVRVRGLSGSYCANHLATVIHDGRYHLSFVSSGYATLVPIDQVEKIELRLEAQHCVACDAPLATWPANDPSFGPQP